MTKNKSEKMHFRRRCLERLGAVYTQDGLLRDLRDGKLDFVEKQSNRVTVWRKGDAVFVYDKSRKTFVTALTYGMWKDGKVFVQ